MLLLVAVFFLLYGQSSCFSPQAKCYDLTFGKCSTRTYCGKTDTGLHACLPCPSGKLCPGDGYTYLAPQVNGLKINHNTARYITNIKNNSYIVSSNRILIRKKLKKLKKIVKIVKVGLKVAAIVKTGGVAGLKQAAAAKIKQLAVKKGIQCLKNGLSNFCNGKKKGGKLGLPKGLKVKPKIGGAVRKPEITKSKVTNTNMINPRARNPKTRTSKARTRTSKTKPLLITKGKIKGKIKGKTKGRVKRKVTKPCSNIFDSLANKVNNATSHVAYKAVNKGRDWLKKNVGGNTGNCEKSVVVKRNPGKNPTNLRGSKSKTKPKPRPRGSGSSSTDDSTNAPSSDDMPAVTRSTDNSMPTFKSKTQVKRSSPTRTDDTPVKPKPQVKRSPPTKTYDNIIRPVRRTKPQLKRLHPTKTDDNIIRPVRRTKPQVKRLHPTKTDDALFKRTKQPITRTDDTVIISQSPRPVTRTRSNPKPSRRPIRKHSRTRSKPKPSRRPVAIRVTANPVSRPTRTPTVTLTVGPTRQPTARSTRIPSAISSRRPTVIPPTRNPTRVPTARPSPLPTSRPSVRPTLTPTAVAGPPTMLPYSGVGWAAFSTAPVPVTPSAFPSRVPTISMFSMLTNIPTRTPTSLRVSIASPTISPSKLIPTKLPSLNPTLVPSVTPSFQASFQPSFQPSAQPSFAPTNSQTAAVGASSINNASTGDQSKISTTVIGSIAGCLILVILIITFCICFIKKSKEKKNPYEIWSSYYSNKNQPTHIQPQTHVNEDIHHFYRKSQRPSVNQNSVFTPHVSGRTSFRNSQIVTQMGPQANYKRQSLALTTRNSQPNYPL